MTSELLYITIFLAVILMLSCSDKETASDEFSTYMARSEQVWQFRGTYLVARGDSILARGSCGYANEEKKTYNTPKTKFLIGSVTKPLTAIAILQLTEKGLIKLDVPVSKYLHNYPKDVADKVTVHHLLTHCSGIPDVINNMDFIGRTHEKMTPREIAGFFQDYPLDFNPGEEHAYSSSNYILLGLIIESVSNYSWEEYVNKFICLPAGMENTGVYDDYSTRSDFATGYSPSPGGSLFPARPIHPSCGYSAGSLSSTVDDLFSLHSALSKANILSEQSIALMEQQHVPAYGYGWLVDDFGGHRLVAHGGGVPGFVSLLQRWPDDSICVVILSNNVTVPAHSIANALAAIAMSEPYENPQIKTSEFLESKAMKEYEGNYRLNTGEVRRIYCTGGQLVARRASGAPVLVFSEGNDRFFFAHDHMTTLEFFRDSEGLIKGQVIHQAFDSDTAWKIGGINDE